MGCHFVIVTDQRALVSLNSFVGPDGMIARRLEKKGTL